MAISNQQLTRKKMNKSNIYYHKNITLEQALAGGNFQIYLQNGKKVKVDIKPGINDGQIIRLKEMGQMGEKGSRGDVLIKLNVMDHPLYKLHGLDLHALLILTPAEAELGCLKTMPGPDGKKLSVKVPPKSKQGTIVVLENGGIRKNENRGNIRFEVVIEDLNAFEAIFQTNLLSNSGTSFN